MEEEYSTERDEDAEVLSEQQKEETEESEHEEYECPECGAKITVDMTSCPNCGIGLSFEYEDDTI